MNRYVSTIMLFVVLMLTGLGLVMISSTSGPIAQASSQWKRQVVWFIVGLFLFGVVGWRDYRKWRSWVWILFGITLGLLVLVLIPGIGSKVKGASRWLGFHGVKIQPSEFLRLTLVMVIADGLAKYQSKIQDYKKGLFWPLGVLMVPVILLRFEPDFGTIFLISATVLLMMFISGAKIMPIIGTGLVGIIGFVTMLWLQPERRGRLLAFMNPEQYKDGEFYQIWQGMMAFGSGGLHGLGLGNSRQKAGFVPESTTDSIFPIIGEELGFYVCIIVVASYLVILLCGIWISMKSMDTYGYLLGFGLTFGLVLQAMINIATVTGSMPPKGMPLPFVSYGGSNLLISYIAIGFLISIHRESLRAKRYSGGMSIDDETPQL